MENKAGCGSYFAGGLIGAAYGIAILFAISRVIDVDDLSGLILLPAAPLVGILAGSFMTAFLSRRSKRAKIIAMCAPAVAILCSFALPDKLDGPSDNKLAAIFRAKRSTFDSIERDLSQGRSPSPIDLKAIGASESLKNANPPYDVKLPIWSYGSGHLFAEEDAKGYACCNLPLANSRGDHKNYVYIQYHPLEGHWYVYYDHQGE